MSNNSGSSATLLNNCLVILHNTAFIENQINQMLAKNIEILELLYYIIYKNIDNTKYKEIQFNSESCKEIEHHFNIYKKIKTSNCFAKKTNNITNIKGNVFFASSSISRILGSTIFYCT